MLHYIIFFIIALVPCIIGSISGIGGGIIIKPVLDMVSGNGLFGPEEINFLSGCTVLAMSFVSLLRSRKTGVRLEGGIGFSLASGAVAGGLFGKMLFSFAVMSVNKNLVTAIQSSILIIMTGLVVLYIRKKDSVTKKNICYLPFCVVLGLCMGLVSAFLGIGGGPINMMVLSYFLSMDTKTSALHSLFIIFLSQLASFILTVGTDIPPVPLSSLFTMIAGGVMGAFIGSRIVKHLRNEQVDRLFNMLMLVVIALCVFNLMKSASGLAG